MNIWITGINLSIDTAVMIESTDKYKRLHAKQWKSVGSKGANVFRSLLHLGTTPHLIGVTWGITGEYIKSILKRLCPNPIHLHILHFKHQESRINIIEIDKHEEKLISASSPVLSPDIFSRFLKSISKQIQPDDVLILTGSFPQNITLKNLLPLIQFFDPRNIWIDLKGKHLIDAYHYIPKGIFKINHIEKEDFTEKNILPENLIVTSSTRVIAKLGEKHIVVNIPQVPVINTIGAGDVFMASMVYEKIVAQKNWTEALKISSARATASTQTLGVSIWKEEIANQLLSSITVFHY